MEVHKPTKQNKKGSSGTDSSGNKENHLPSVDQDTLKSAALMRLIDTFVRTKPRLTVPDCMRHAGLPENVVRNTTIQQRVRRLVKKLDVPSVVAAMDDSLLECHGIRSIPCETPEQTYYVMMLKAAVLIHLIESHARDEPLLSAHECLLHAGLTSDMAQDATTQPLLFKLVDLVSLEDVLARIDHIVPRKPQNVLGPVASVPVTTSAVIR